MNDGNTNTDTGNNQTDGTETVTGADITNQQQVDNIEKHINLALEAQDGPAVKDGEATTQQPGATTPGKEQAAAGQGGASSGSNGTAQQQPAKGGKKEEESGRGPQDLVLKGQGPNGTDVVIKGGAERRFYEQARVAREQVTHVTGERDRLRTELTNAQQRLQQMEQTVQSVNGAPPQQVATGVRLVQDLQRDPVGTLTKLLAEATAKGYKVDGIGSQVDTAAVQRMLDERLGSTMATQEPTDDELRAEAVREANTFFSQFPDALPHDKLIASVMRDNPGVDLHTAYFGLKSQFADRGFDWSRPLDEQLAERATASGTQQQQTDTQTSGQQTTVQPGLPSSRPAVPAAAQVDKGAQVAHEATSMDDIIRSSMRDAGLNV
jgi:hypothetical protein